MMLRVGNIALSLGERVSGDGAFSSRRRTGEGFLPLANQLVPLKLRIRYSLPLPFAAQPNRSSKRHIVLVARPEAEGKGPQSGRTIQMANRKCQKSKVRAIGTFAICLLRFDF
jgi:hypothetical protein